MTNHDITLNDANTEIRIKEGKTKIEYMKLFKKLDNEFMDNLLCKQYMSTYSESLQYNLYNFPISCTTGYLKKTVSKYALDFVYAYSSILYQSEFISVATPFDNFVKYEKEEIEPSNLYIIKLNFTTFNKILSDTTIRLIYGINLIKILKHQNVRIISVCKLNKTKQNDMLPSIMDKIIESDLKRADGKFMLNKNIGLTGKKFAQGLISGLYDNQEEANLYLKDALSFYPKHVNNTELWYVKQKGERKPLKNGFYLILH